MKTLFNPWKWLEKLWARFARDLRGKRRPYHQTKITNIIYSIGRRRKGCEREQEVTVFSPLGAPLVIS